MAPVSLADWSNLADIIGGLATGFAAVSALVFYLVDSRKVKASQARLVRANLHPEPEGTFEVSVANESDRPILLELLFWREIDFAEALMDGRPMEPRDPIQRGTNQHGEPVFSDLPMEDAYRHVTSKDELLGFGAGGGTADLRFVLGDQSRLTAGRSVRFLMERVLYQVDREYSLYFLDANGLAWELSLAPDGGPPGKLRSAGHRRKANGLGGTRPGRRMMAIGYARVAKRGIETWLERRLWLYNHRKERTTSYPRLSAESWQRLMSARSERLERERPTDLGRRGE